MKYGKVDNIKVKSKCPRCNKLHFITLFIEEGQLIPKKLCTKCKKLINSYSSSTLPGIHGNKGS